MPSCQVEISRQQTSGGEDVYLEEPSVIRSWSLSSSTSARPAERGTIWTSSEMRGIMWQRPPGNPLTALLAPNNLWDASSWIMLYTARALWLPCRCTPRPFVIRHLRANQLIYIATNRPADGQPPEPLCSSLLKAFCCHSSPASPSSDPPQRASLQLTTQDKCMCGRLWEGLATRAPHSHAERVK